MTGPEARARAAVRLRVEADRLEGMMSHDDDIRQAVDLIEAAVAEVRRRRECGKTET